MNEKQFVKSIYDDAKSLGACQRFEDSLSQLETIRDLMRILHTPQGSEFCVEHNFPSLQRWEEGTGAFDLREYGVYVGEVVSLKDIKRCYLINCSGRITCNHPDSYRVHLLHGSNIEVVASNYSAVAVECSHDSTKISKTNDKTAVII